MERRHFGGTKVKVPVLGQGTWHLEQADRAEALASLQAGLDAGMCHIDTAEMYGDGEAERLVGAAIAGRRAEVFLASKVLPQHASRQGTVRACEASLRRLGTDHLDLYLLHWPGEEPLEDTIAGFEALAKAGKIRAWGLSNFDVPELEHAQKIAGPGRIACNQVLYHLQERAIEHAVLPWCERHGVAVVAYSPFGSGDFPSPRSAGGKLLGELARAHGGTPRQVALAFLVRHRCGFAIPKASSAAHARENAGAAELKLSSEELRRLDAAFPLGPRPRALPTL